MRMFLDVEKNVENKKILGYFFLKFIWVWVLVLWFIVSRFFGVVFNRVFNVCKILI